MLYSGTTFQIQVSVGGHEWVIESLENGIKPGERFLSVCGKGGTILNMAQSGSGTAVTHDPDPFWVREQHARVAFALAFAF